MIVTVVDIVFVGTPKENMREEYNRLPEWRSSRIAMVLLTSHFPAEQGVKGDIAAFAALVSRRTQGNRREIFISATDGP